MKLRLWNFQKKKNSTKIPSSEYIEIEVLLKEETDLVNPTFKIDGVPNYSINYCYLVEADRYYFIDNYRQGNSKIYEIDCVTDYLATYKSSIGSYSAYIERSSSNFDNYIVDNEVAQSTEPEVVVVSGGHLIISQMYGTFILYTIGNDVSDATGGLCCYACTPATLDDLFDVINNQSAYDQVKFTFQGGVKEAIQACIWVPQNVPTHENLSVIKLGNFSTGVAAAKIDSAGPFRDNTITIDIPWQSEDFSSSSWGTKMELYLPMIGNLSINPNDFLGSSSIIIDLIIDNINGAFTYTIKNDSGSIKYVQAGNAGITFPIALTGLNWVKGYESGIKGISTSLSSTLSGAYDMFKAHITPEESIIGSYESRGITANEIEKEVKLTMYYYKPIELSDTQTSGRPCGKKLTISTLSGYVKCRRASIDISGLGGDKDAVNSYLNNGFYYE